MGDSDIYIFADDGSKPKRLHHSPNQDGQPAASPSDKKIIAFVRDGDIWLMNIDGSNQLQLTSGGDIDTDPAWSPDVIHDRLYPSALRPGAN